MNFIGTLIRQPVTVIVGVVMIVLAGVIALQRIPIQLAPNVEDTIIAVTTRWEGASPEEIEREIVERQEEKLQGLANLRAMTSESQQGTGVIRLEFAVGTDKDAALREVSDKLREVPEYPENADEPVVEASDPENRDFIAWIIFGTTDPDLDIRTLQDFAEDRIEPLLERIEGMSEVNVLGGREREVQIRVDPVLLAQYGIPPAELVSAIQRTNRNVSGGELADAKFDVRLRTISQYTSVEDVENTVIRQSEGGPVFVGDVAEVVETFKEPTAFVRSKGQPVLAINAQKEVGANVIEVMAGLRAALDTLRAEGGVLETEKRRLGLNGELYLRQAYDQTVYIDDALALVRNNVWLGGSLAVVVLVLFLRSARSVGIVALAIPISVMGAIVVMVAMGRTINVISLAGMAFAVGLVVDNAIVVLENIFRHLEMRKDPMQAALDGAREVWGAVLAATLTTIVVFVPILFVKEEAGQLFRDIALAICAAVALSLVVSITVIPTAAGRLLRPHAAPPGTPRHRGVVRRLLTGPSRAVHAVGALMRGLPRAVGRLIYWICGSVVARVAVVVLLTVVSVAGSLMLMPPADYLPKGNRNLVFGLLIPPPGYNLSKQEAVGRRVEETMRPFWEAGDLTPGSEKRRRSEARLEAVPTFDWAMQQPGPPVVPPPIDNYFFVSRGGVMFHGAIASEPERVVDIQPLMQHATRAEVIPGVLGFAFQLPLFRLGGSTGSAIKIDFSAGDLASVTQSAAVAYRELGQRYGF
ncbi:MAG: efflux RND transporter permease subunit, partial [Planctomycetota bacterium]